MYLLSLSGDIRTEQTRPPNRINRLVKLTSSVRRCRQNLAADLAPVSKLCDGCGRVRVIGCVHRSESFGASAWPGLFYNLIQTLRLVVRRRGVIFQAINLSTLLSVQISRNIMKYHEISQNFRKRSADVCKMRCNCLRFGYHFSSFSFFCNEVSRKFLFCLHNRVKEKETLLKYNDCAETIRKWILYATWRILAFPNGKFLRCNELH